MRIEEKVAVVTGGGSGIGEEVCRRLAGAGGRVVVADVSGGEAERVAASLREAGHPAVHVQGDVAVPAEAARCVEAAVETFGRLDIVVNNAGIVRDAQLVKMTEAAWDAVVAVNLTGVVSCSRAAVPFMKRQRAGKIVNIASRSLLGNFGQTNYAATKAGVVGFTKSLAVELGPFNVNVNAIAPGFIETAIMRTVDPAVREKAVKAAPLGRGGTPRDVANTVLFLASEEAGFITGQCIFVCGGRSVRAALELWA